MDISNCLYCLFVCLFVVKSLLRDLNYFSAKHCFPNRPSVIHITYIKRHIFTNTKLEIIIKKNNKAIIQVIYVFNKSYI